jgi:hypothetical protein
MIAIDTNVLVAAHRADHQQHAQADAALRDLCGRGETWALPWPCVHEFLGLVTHPRIWPKPTPGDQALEAIDRWRRLPFVHSLAEDAGYWPVLCELVRAAAIAGPRIHDARIAALCLHHGVGELWTADRDFSRFPRLRVRNPLVSA